VGGEPRGRESIRALRREKVDPRHVSFDRREPTGAAIIAVDASGEKQIAAALGANDSLGLAQIRAAAELLQEAAVLLCNFEAPARCVLAAAKIAARHGAKIILDPAPPTAMPEELYPLLYAIRPNSDEARHLTGIEVCDRASARRAGQKLRDKGVKVVALQAGNAGDLVLSDQGEFFLPRLKVKTVDATGAGDAFAGVFAAAIAKGLDLREAARLANAAAALSTTKAGARDALPRRKAVEDFLRK
jgi:ribokinase